MAGFLYSYRLGDPEDPRYVLHVGSMLRLTDALIPVVKLDIGHMAVSVSYDVNTSQLRNASYGRGGFELALGYQNFKIVRQFAAFLHKSNPASAGFFIPF